MRSVYFLIFLIFPCLLAQGEDFDLSKLASENFEEREKAQREAGKWVMSQPAEAKRILLKEYLKSDEPELRIRILPLLERAYFPPKGYVGIFMRDNRYDNLGRPRAGDVSELAGIRVTKVAPGTPAEKSGLKINDVILKIDDWTVPTSVERTSVVAQQIQRNPPLAPMQLQVRRGAELLQIELKLGVLPVPSQRAQSLLADDSLPFQVLPKDLSAQILEFRVWLAKEIRKDRKNLIADRR